MSYEQQYHERIPVHYSGTATGHGSCSCGKSVSCSCHYSGTTYEDIYTNIEVDTNPFDRSINSCNASVNILTGAVVATEAAQIASIDSNAKKIGSTIVEGFFKTIRSEISQQIAEISSKLESHLAHLHSMAKRCIEKQMKMKDDYQRISNRYLKIFGDLDNELSNRIYEMDKPAFVFKNQCDSHTGRTLTGDLASTVAVFGAEGGNLQARISASVAKKHALDAINSANTFLVKQKRLNYTINQTVLNENAENVQYSPVCFMETKNEKNQIDKNVYTGALNLTPAPLIDRFNEKTWSSVSKDNAEKIGRYFNAEVSSRYSKGDIHTNRVRENVIKLLNFNQIKSI